MTIEEKKQHVERFEQTVESLESEIRRLHKLLSEHELFIGPNSVHQQPPVLIIQVKLPKCQPDQGIGPQITEQDASMI